MNRPYERLIDSGLEELLGPDQAPDLADRILERHREGPLTPHHQVAPKQEQSPKLTRAPRRAPWLTFAAAALLSLFLIRQAGSRTLMASELRGRLHSGSFEFHPAQGPIRSLRPGRFSLQVQAQDRLRAHPTLGAVIDLGPLGQLSLDPASELEILEIRNWRNARTHKESPT